MEMSLLSCPVCLKPHFEGVDALRSSLINVATSHISCPVCNELLLGLDKLTIHLFSHISNNNKISQDSSLPTNTNKTTQTQVGSDTFNEVQDIVMTEKTELDGLAVEDKMEKLQVTCDICNFHFSDEAILDLHQKLLHQTSPDKKTGRYNYHCHLCSKQFKMRGSLMVHLRVAHFSYIQSNHRSSNTDALDKEKSVEEPQVFLVPSVDKQKNVAKNQDNKQWECEVCRKLFTTKYFLKKHKRLHTGEMPYYCSQCNKYFTFQQSYHKHMLYHSDDKPHICTECGRAFKELSTLHNHERIHSGERPFSCETCGKCFRQRVSYLVHRRIHTGAMPYKCTACNKSFRYKVSQRSHKCPVNPPGCVVRTPDLVEKLIQNQNQKLNTNAVKFDLSEEINRQASTETIESPAVDFEFQDDFTPFPNDNNANNRNSNIAVSITPTDSANPDFFALILSPVLSDVQSLCLSNYAAQNDTKKEDSNNALQTINEESFKELLYGPNKQ